MIDWLTEARERGRAETYDSITKAHEARIIGVMVLGKTRLANVFCYAPNGVSFASHMLPEAEAIAVLAAKAEQG